MGEFFNRLRALASHTDAVLAIGVLGLVVLLLVPLPPFLLDMLLCLSIVFSVMALLLTLYVENALEFSAFPSLLLFLTLYRLGLNIASTRMILTRGQGGDIIRTFGEFVTDNNLVVGLILFALLTIINFIVVTKGSGRIAEVAARFTLEALPGKQLAIDGEFGAGLITQEEAKGAREKINAEAEFYGAMDGASKFVRGDAIAGLVITCVNICGGLIVGMTMKGMPWQNCLETFTRLTVGDGLVSQIPALLISVAAGIMVTRASSGSLWKTLTKQVFHHPKVLLITAGSVLVLCLVPGMPVLVMLPIGGIFLVCGYLQLKRGGKGEEKKPKRAALSPLFVHPLEVELGYQAVILADSLLQRLPTIRKEVGAHLGSPVPYVHISDNAELPPTAWRMRVKGTPTASGRGGELHTLVEALKRVIEEHAHELLTRQDVAQMIQDVKRYDSAVVEELVGKKLSIGQLVKVLQSLLKEGVPIRDFVTILEILADHAKGEESDLEELTEAVRRGLSKGISEEFFGKTRIAHVITIDPKVERILDLSKGKVRLGTIDKLARSLIVLAEQAEKRGVKPVVVTEIETRAKLKKLIEKQLPRLAVLSYGEVAPDIELREIGNVSNDVLI
ncbi:MAG: FHIPEP family type III secretion protein [Chlamydiales bacterium]|nr:FHIPEP family type III secretion protein [Chlamydiales bacterium]